MARSFVRRVAGRGVREARALKHRLAPAEAAAPPASPAADGSTWTPTLTDLDVLTANVKNLGYEVARRRVEEVLSTVDASREPRHHGTVSKATTQADMESPWFAYWCAQLRIAPLYHRKLWEFAVLLQTLHEHDRLRAGMRGVGFGCGEEPLASYFASHDMDVLITDLDAGQSAGKGWVETGQHALSKDLAFKPELVDRERFDRHVAHRFVDMNNIPDDIGDDYDFCWSVCAMEHLGSIELGLAFVESSLQLLRPGGIAIHTTEYNYLPTGDTIRSGPTVLFQREHFEQLADRIAAHGGRMLGPDFDIGSGVLDRYVDVPPYFLEGGLMGTGAFDDVNQAAHLRMLLGGFPITCFAVIAERR
jgi:SAM-dependent methyltransferase